MHGTFFGQLLYLTFKTYIIFEIGLRVLVEKKKIFFSIFGQKNEKKI